jgi:hypothetical protein
MRRISSQFTPQQSRLVLFLFYCSLGIEYQLNAAAAAGAKKGNQFKVIEEICFLHPESE